MEAASFFCPPRRAGKDIADSRINFTKKQLKETETSGV
jgi:hypothetical protein